MDRCKLCGATTLPGYDDDSDECVFCEIKRLRLEFIAAKAQIAITQEHVVKVEEERAAWKQSSSYSSDEACQSLRANMALTKLAAISSHGSDTRQAAEYGLVEIQRLRNRIDGLELNYRFALELLEKEGRISVPCPSCGQVTLYRADPDALILRWIVGGCSCDKIETP